MKRQTALLAVAATLAFTGLVSCDQQSTSGSEITVVDIGRVLKDSSVGKQESEHDKQVQALLLKAQGDANEEYESLPEAEQQKNRAADEQVLNRQWMAEQQAARQASLKAIIKAVDDYRQEKKLTLIMDSQSVISSDEKMDITEDIISRLAKTTVEYGALPTVTVRSPTTKASDPAAKK